MFGLAPTLAIHRVRAHSRVLADGTSVFVGEHLRWSRGRTHRVSRPRLPDTPPPGQLGLFDDALDEPDTPDITDIDEPEAEPPGGR